MNFSHLLVTFRFCFSTASTSNWCLVVRFHESKSVEDETYGELEYAQRFVRSHRQFGFGGYIGYQMSSVPAYIGPYSQRPGLNADG